MDGWLAEQRRTDDIAVISPARSFAMSEEDYDEAIGSRQADSAGGTVFDLWRECGGGDGGLALELGAGSGAVTTGFVQAAEGFTTLVTDPSVEFLSLTRRKLAGLPNTQRCDVRYATLLGEDLRVVPRELVDVVFAQACLHHVADWKQLLRDIKDVLVPGGVLMFQEPFSEGTYFMGLAAEMLLRAQGVPDADRERLEQLRQSIYLLSDRTINKDHGEDKHCFYTDEMIETCQQVFGNVRFLRNQSFESIAAALPTSRASLDFHSSRQASSASFTEYCRSFFVYHHGLSALAMEEFDRVVVPQFERLDLLYKQGDGPALLAVVLCRKPSSLRAKADKLQQFVTKKVADELSRT
jgi:ubiquinone/menaquinone biosynthesis C-methylase UbiE